MGAPMSKTVRTRIPLSMFLPLRDWGPRTTAEPKTAAPDSADPQPLWPLNAGPVPAILPALCEKKTAVSHTCNLYVAPCSAGPLPSAEK
jgi:hypothetical protein